MKLLKFYAEWCQPCKALNQVIKGAGENVTVPIEEVDIDANMELSMQYKVRSVPTMVLLNDDGVEIKRTTGMMNEQKLLDFLKV